MNIYLHVEIADRELDAKLLLGVLAASKGNEVLISSLGYITSGLKMNILKPGIFHTKSLTPSKSKIERHKKIIDHESKITSIDEEAGITLVDNKTFVNERYSNHTIKQSSAIFSWGLDDTETLKKNYPNYFHKIHKTCSPRVDLWRKLFEDYWVKPKEMPKKPFLLVSANMICNNQRPFHEEIKFHSDAGYFLRNPKLFKDLFYNMAEDYKKLYEFIEAIKFLSKNISSYDIVLRPHPRDNIDAWKIFFENTPNVKVIKKDSISVWVQHSFAVMHNGCTTAIEALISNKPVITYSPFKMKFAHKIPNLVGCVVKTKEELLKKTNEIYIFNKARKIKIEKIPKIITNKIFIDLKELAAEKILKVWESLNDNKISQKNNWLKFYLFCKLVDLKRAFNKLKSKILNKRFQSITGNYKFSQLNENDIKSKVLRLQKILGIKIKLECKLLSNRAILIKKSKK